MATKKSTVTELLQAWNSGDQDAATAMLPLVYDELRAIARGYFRHERRDHTLEATAIVHEAYVKLVEQNGVEWQNRAHFIGLAAHVMRRVLVDYARERNTAKRGGKVPRVTLIEADAVTHGRTPDMIALDTALTELAEIDPQKAQIVELKFFGGLTIEETAQYLGISSPTVVRQWRRAKAWLYRQLMNGQPA
ncbi:MAG: sigma-70 family RNA polymerase sigma factor [bacterium]|nr:sigma-70 family RNA polymerase sigma factor [bacterium]